MHDALYDREPPLDPGRTCSRPPASLGLDMDRFDRDLDDPSLRERVEEDLADGRANGVTATPTIFVDGQRYDGAWDFYSMLEALERPVGARVKRTARAFANLPASAGLVLLLAARPRPWSAPTRRSRPPTSASSTPGSASARRRRRAAAERRRLVLRGPARPSSSCSSGWRSGAR